MRDARTQHILVLGVGFDFGVFSVIARSYEPLDGIEGLAVPAAGSSPNINLQQMVMKLARWRKDRIGGAVWYLDCDLAEGYAGLASASAREPKALPPPGMMVKGTPTTHYYKLKDSPTSCKLGIEIEVGVDRHVYCLNVRLNTVNAEIEVQLPAAVR